MKHLRQQMSEASNKEEMLVYREKLLESKQENVNLQQVLQQELQSKYRLEELLRIKGCYFFNEDEGVYRETTPKNSQNLAYCPKCMHSKEKLFLCVFHRQKNANDGFALSVIGKVGLKQQIRE